MARRWTRGVLGFGLAGGAALLFLRPSEKRTVDRPSEPCTVSAQLVDSCSPLFGAAVAGYSEVPRDPLAQFEHLERRVGRQLEVVHTFDPAGSIPLRPERPILMARPDLVPYVNWRPHDRWASAAGGDPEVDAYIDKVADSIRGVAPRRIFLTLHHEPENDVSSSTPPCNDAGVRMAGSAGTPEGYRAMWANVRRRFDARGVSNVVWVMNYMNYPRWDCLVDELWPGNDLVDWVTFEAYWSAEAPTWDEVVGRFYRLLDRRSDEAHDFRSKPWGIAEFGATGASQEEVLRFYASAKEAIAKKRYPRLHLYLAFDSPGDEGYQDLRVGYDLDGRFDKSEQAAFNEIARLPELGLRPLGTRG